MEVALLRIAMDKEAVLLIVDLTVDPALDQTRDIVVDQALGPAVDIGVDLTAD